MKRGGGGKDSTQTYTHRLYSSLCETYIHTYDKYTLIINIYPSHLFLLTSASERDLVLDVKCETGAITKNPWTISGSSGFVPYHKQTRT